MRLLIALVLLGIYEAIYISFENQRCFDILGVTPEDSPVSIKSKYRQLALLYHPDRVHASSVRLNSEDNINMQDINDAYDCVTRVMAGEEEPALSQRAETIKTLGLELWASTSAIRREEIITLINEYVATADMMEDVSFLIGKFFMNNEPDALQSLIMLTVVGFVANFILCTIGSLALIYITYRITKRVVLGTFWLVMYTLRFIYRLLLAPRHEKYD